MFTYFQHKNKPEKYLLVYLWVIFPSLNWCRIFFLNAPKTHFKLVETRSKIIDWLIDWKEFYVLAIFQPCYCWKQRKIYRLSYEMVRIAIFRIIFWRNKIHFDKFFTKFPVFTNTMKQITFETGKIFVFCVHLLCFCIWCIFTKPKPNL